MSTMDYAKQARPYARAAFEYAVEHNQLAIWSETLQNFAEIAKQPLIIKILRNPELIPEQACEVFAAVYVKPIEPHLQTFLRILADNDRLILLPEIYRFFERYRAAKEKILDVNVSSAIELTENERDLLTEKLTKKIGRQVSLHCKIDSTLIGGLIIKIGDTVMDNSVRGQFMRLREILAT